MSRSAAPMETTPHDDHLPFIAAVRTPRDRRKDWRGYFTAQLAACDSLTWLDGDGFLREHEGRYAWIELDDARRWFSDATWFDLATPCPHVGEIAGFFNWESWREFDGREFLASSVLFSTFGYLARTDRPSVARIDAIVEESFPLADAALGGGFHDGDFFLRGATHAGYTRYVRDEIEARLATFCLTPQWMTSGTFSENKRVGSRAASCEAAAVDGILAACRHALGSRSASTRPAADLRSAPWCSRSSASTPPQRAP